MGWFTLFLYLAVALIWLGLLKGYFGTPAQKTKRARYNLLFMTLVVIALTAMQVFGLRL